MKFYPHNNQCYSVFQGLPQLLHAAWTWPNTQWISRRVPCNWKAVRQVVLSICIPLEKYLSDHFHRPLAVKYYWRGWSIHKSQVTTREIIKIKLKYYFHTQINLWSFTENSMGTEILTLNKTKGDATRSVLQELLQLFCRSLGGVLWAGIFQHCWGNMFFSHFCLFSHFQILRFFFFTWKKLIRIRLIFKAWSSYFINLLSSYWKRVIG